MCFTSAELQSFLVAPWSLPLRRVCAGVSEQVRQRVTRETEAPLPRWVSPQYLYRWLGEAIATRAAWEATQPDGPRYRFGRRSEPCWSQTVTLPIATRPLRPLPEDELLWYFGMGLERLYRITQTPPEEIGQDLWTQTLLGACQYLAQLYRVLLRRGKARRARALLREELCRFLTWDSEQIGEG